MLNINWLVNTSFIFVWALYSLIIQYVLEWLILTRVIFVQERLYSLQDILCFWTVFNEIPQCCLESYFAVPDSPWIRIRVYRQTNYELMKINNACSASTCQNTLFKLVSFVSCPLRICDHDMLCISIGSFLVI